MAQKHCFLRLSSLMTVLLLPFLDTFFCDPETEQVKFFFDSTNEVVNSSSFIKQPLFSFHFEAVKLSFFILVIEGIII